MTACRSRLSGFCALNNYRSNRQSGRRAAERNVNRSTAIEHSQPNDQVLDSRERSLTTPTHSTPSVEGPNYHAIQAKNIIQLELNDSRHVDRGRQSILRSALQLVSQIAESEPQHSDEIMEEFQPNDPALSIPDAPPRELLFMLLQGMSFLHCYVLIIVDEIRAAGIDVHSVAGSHLAQNI